MKVLMLSRAKWIQSKYNTRRTLGRQTRRWWEQQRALRRVVTTLFPNVSRQSVVSVRALPVPASVRHPWHEAMSSPVIRRRGSSVCVDALNLNSPSLTLVSLSLSFFCLFHLLYITQPHTVLPCLYLLFSCWVYPSGFASDWSRNLSSIRRRLRLALHEYCLENKKGLKKSPVSWNAPSLCVSHFHISVLTLCC